ncbi:TPA: FaeA/PapI family transcriptional regulator [Aeromonas hydrophila]|uniref:FaeA/PapI family transcriptional regulator n=1 Tax=Aeromonas hydrophila TaxID=644 RepID=UPI0038D2575A
MKSAILTFLLRQHADIEPITTRQVADAFGISVYSARYYLLQLEKQRYVSKESVARGAISRWTLLLIPSFETSSPGE